MALRKLTKERSNDKWTVICFESDGKGAVMQLSKLRPFENADDMIIGSNVKCKAYAKYKATIKYITDEEDDAYSFLDNFYKDEYNKEYTCDEESKKEHKTCDDILQLIEGIQHPRGVKKRSTEVQDVNCRKTKRQKDVSKIKKSSKDDRATKVQKSQLSNVELLHKRSKERAKKYAAHFAKNTNAKTQPSTANTSMPLSESNTTATSSDQPPSAIVTLQSSTQPSTASSSLSLSRSDSSPTSKSDCQPPSAIVTLQSSTQPSTANSSMSLSRSDSSPTSKSGYQPPSAIVTLQSSTQPSTASSSMSLSQLNCSPANKSDILSSTMISEGQISTRCHTYVEINQTASTNQYPSQGTANNLYTNVGMGNNLYPNHGMKNNLLPNRGMGNHQYNNHGMANNQYPGQNIDVSMGNNPYTKRNMGNDLYLNQGMGNDMNPNQGMGNNPYPNQDIGNNLYPNEGIVNNPYTNHGVGNNLYPNQGTGNNLYTNQGMGYNAYTNQVMGTNQYTNQGMANNSYGYQDMGNWSSGNTITAMAPWAETMKSQLFSDVCSHVANQFKTLHGRIDNNTWGIQRNARDINVLQTNFSKGFDQLSQNMATMTECIVNSIKDISKPPAARKLDMEPVENPLRISSPLLTNVIEDTMELENIQLEPMELQTMSPSSASQASLASPPSPAYDQPKPASQIPASQPTLTQVPTTDPPTSVSDTVCDLPEKLRPITVVELRKAKTAEISETISKVTKEMYKKRGPGSAICYLLDTLFSEREIIHTSARASGNNMTLDDLGIRMSLIKEFLQTNLGIDMKKIMDTTNQKRRDLRRRTKHRL